MPWLAEEPPEKEDRLNWEVLKRAPCFVLQEKVVKVWKIFLFCCFALH